MQDDAKADRLTTAEPNVWTAMGTNGITFDSCIDTRVYAVVHDDIGAGESPSRRRPAAQSLPSGWNGRRPLDVPHNGHVTVPRDGASTTPRDRSSPRRIPSPPGQLFSHLTS